MKQKEDITQGVQDNGLLQRQQVKHQNVRNVLTTWFTTHICNK